MKQFKYFQLLQLKYIPRHKFKLKALDHQGSIEIY